MTGPCAAALAAWLALPGGAAPAEAAPTTAPARKTNLQAVAGTWALQQVSSAEQLRRLVPKVVSPALRTPGLRGFSLRVPWHAVADDFALLEAGLALARRHKLAYSVRFMAGRHTPRGVFEKGCRFYERPARADPQRRRVPVPFLADGSPNAVFEAAYEQFTARLARWCRSRGVRLLHMAWYGQDWAELNHGREIRRLKGYSYANWLGAHTRLMDIAFRHAGDDLAVEFPFSGYGPLTQAAMDLAVHAERRLGAWSPRFFFQANGWGPRGDWGAPTPATEAAFDRVWARPVFRGQQAIQPRDYDWAALYVLLRQNRATYCEVYTPSFTLARRGVLAEQIARFAGQGATTRPVGEQSGSRGGK